MSEPTAALTTLRASTADLVHGLETAGWSDDDARGATLCAGWTRGHVLTHLARNADGIGLTLAGALRNEIVERYPDGWDARNQAIEAGSARPFAVLLADVRDSAQRLDRVLGAVSDAHAWDRPTAQGRDAYQWVSGRLKEVEIHRVDLLSNYGPQDWPPAFVADLLPTVAGTFASRAPGPLRVAVTAEGSIAVDLVGSIWTVGGDGESGLEAGEQGDGEPVEVFGPDWAVLAWAVGRPTIAAAALSATPDLGPWR